MRTLTKSLKQIQYIKLLEKLMTRKLNENSNLLKNLKSLQSLKSKTEFKS